MTGAGLDGTLRVSPNLGALADAMAAALAERAWIAVQARGVFRLVLNGGGTPQPLFERLGRPPLQGMDFWTRTEIYWGDERCVPPDQPGSNYRQAADAFLNANPIPETNVHRILGELPAEEAAQQYQAVLAAHAEPGRTWPRFDLVLLGVGADGHTASLFPGHAVPDPHASVLAVTADYEGRPAQRVTLTPAVFNSARGVWFMAAGTAKAGIVRRLLEGDEPQAPVPAQSIRPVEGELVWWLDAQAAALLTPK